MFIAVTYGIVEQLVIADNNHLKNWSLVWDESWKQVRLAPLYDVLCTTVYPSLVREMGVSFGGSRKIDDVTRGSAMS